MNFLIFFKENYLFVIIIFLLLIFMFKFKKDLFKELLISKMLELESNWELEGRQKMEKVLTKAREKHFIFKLLPVKMQIKFIESVYKDIKNKILGIRENKNKIFIEGVNKTIDKAVKTKYKGNCNLVSNNQLEKIKEGFKNDYTGFVDVGVTSDLRKDTKVELRAGVKW